MERFTRAQLEKLRLELTEIATTSPRIVRQERNRAGRDFVIGDVHGAYDSVWNAMQLAGFARTRDRLFSVGDLVDRGAGSHRAGRFLAQPYVYAVRGNHEADLIDLHLDNDDPDETLEVLSRINFNGMGWIAKLTAPERAELLKRFAALPYAMEVQSTRGTVGVLHGEVPRGMDWEDFVAGLEDGDAEVLESCLRGRERLKRGDARGVPGIGRIFAGHTPHQSPRAWATSTRSTPEQSSPNCRIGLARRSRSPTWPSRRVCSRALAKRARSACTTRSPTHRSEHMPKSNRLPRAASTPHSPLSCR
ncbi:metallophosphoesterase [Variovorax ginsengisoli]|uniref:Metallophosphoesterase n=1 Tax=Variovorax ginsengisoli TaxID=363844 RepID=A0ABT8SBV4_9BURK|nr:metallophosphoesterase [Variovorax ginsengisoli]MDN8616512.1 metallophosphoesterase [Variovorax ginsengisoli]MDO1535682.1 metallophosphoesterase [Variovorax ginsengisoli]